MSGSLNDLRRLARKTQDLPAEWGNTHREGRNRQAWLESDIIPVYTFMFLLPLLCVNKNNWVGLPPSPHSLLRLSAAAAAAPPTTRSDAAAPATCGKDGE